MYIQYMPTPAQKCLSLLFIAVTSDRPLSRGSLIQVHSFLAVSLSILLADLRLAHQGSVHRLALTARTVVNDLVRKNVAIDAEVLVAECTLIATACCGNLVTVFVHLGLFLLGWYFRKR